MMRYVLLLLPLVACQGNETCMDWSGGAGGASWGNCGDKKTRKVDCDLKTKPVQCTCTVDGVIGKKFEMAESSKFGTMESATSIANEQCGWHVKR